MLILNHHQCAIVREALIQKKMTKDTIAYYIHAMNHWSVQGCHPECFKKAELQTTFEKYLDDDANIQKIAHFSTIQLLVEQEGRRVA
jgi:hypothetical protein